MFKNHITRKSFSKLRISAHNLEIEIGRHHRPRPTPLNERTCNLCNEHVIQDEYHILMKCTHFNNERKQLLDKIQAIFPCITDMHPDTLFVFLMQCQDYDLAKNLEQFISKIIKKRGTF